MNFSGCNANIYDSDGQYLANVRIDQHNRQDKTIEVSELPDNVTGSCEVVILLAPMPMAYSGTIHRFGGAKLIALYEERSKEQRKATRYKTNLPGIVEHLEYDSKKYRLHTPIKFQIINISKNGLRLCGKTNDLIKGLRPKIRLNIGEGDQILTADVVNNLHKPNSVEEFGCAIYNQKHADSKDGNK